MAGSAVCEAPSAGLLDSPVSALTSLAFVLAAGVIWLRSRDRGGVAPYASLVAGVGLGSFVAHAVRWRFEAVAHDVPLFGVLAFVIADGVADLSGPPRRWWWWAAPTAALVPVAALSPVASTGAQVAAAVVAVPLTAWRAVRRHALRRPIGLALGLLTAGAAIGTLTRAGWPWCVPTSPWQGHGIWHVLAATALVVLAAAVGPRARDVTGSTPSVVKDAGER